MKHTFRRDLGAQKENKQKIDCVGDENFREGTLRR